MNGDLLLCRSWFLGQVNFKGEVICTFFPGYMRYLSLPTCRQQRQCIRDAEGHTGASSQFSHGSSWKYNHCRIPVTGIKKYGMCMRANFNSAGEQPHGLHFPQETVELERNLCIRREQPLMRLKREVAKSQLPSRKPSQRRRKNKGRERD